MQNVSSIGKRALTTAVATATMLWSVGFSSFVAPLTAHAAMAGDLIKGQTLSTLYYYGNDGKRYAFPNEKTYFSWYSDFSGTQTISDSQLAAIPLGGNVVARPGSFWVKIQSDPKTYAVTPNGGLRWIETEAVAVGLAGSDWNQFISDVPDVFFADYTVGASLTSAAAAYNGALVKSGTSYYTVLNNVKRLVTSAGFSANRMQSRFALDGAAINLSAMTAGSDVVSKEAGLSDPAQLPAAAAVTGGLSVSLASDTPVGATLPRGAASVSLFKFNLTANSGSATVSQIVLNLGGIGSTSDFEKVYLYDGATRLTTGRTVNSSSRQVSFGGLSVSLAAGTAKTFTVKGDVCVDPCTPSGDTASFQLASVSSIVSTATVSGNFPVSGNLFTFSNISAGTVTVAGNGTISNPTIGQKDAQIGKFTLSAATEDASVKSINLDIDRASDHTNYKLWKGSTLLASGVSSGTYVMFTLTNPLSVQQGGTENLSVTADIGGRAADTIKVSLEEKTDLVATGSKYGFNMAVTNNYSVTGSACTTGLTTCSFSTIQGGKLTFAFNGPTATDIQIDGKDQVLAKFTVTSQNYVEIRQMKVTIACTSSGQCDDDNDDQGGLIDDLAAANDPDIANLSDISIRKADGTVWMGPQEISVSGSDLTQTLTFSDTQTMQAGQSLDLMVTADVYSGALADDKFTATVLMDASNVLAKDINGKDLVNADMVPGASLSGNNMTVKAAGITVALAAPPSSGSYVRGSSNVPVVGYSFAATKSSLIKVTDLTLTGAMDTGALAGATNGADGEIKNFVSSCSLYDGGTGALVDGPESFGTNVTGTGATVSFTNFAWTIPAGETSKLLVKCNFANVTVSSDLFNFFISAKADITAEDKDGKAIAAASKTFTAELATDVTTRAIPLITVTSAGTLTITQDGSTPKSTIILGASTAVPVAVFKFQAANEDVIVNTLALGNCKGMLLAADVTCSGSGESAGTDAVASVVKVSYQNQSGATVTKSGYLSSNVVTFSDLGFYIPSSTSRTLTVSIDTNTVSSTQGVTSGSQIQLNIINTSADVVGVGSGQSIVPTWTTGSSDLQVLSNMMTIRKTKPTFSLASGSPSGAAIPGLAEVLRFNVSADSRGFVGLNGVTFKVTSTDNAGTAWNKNTGGSSATHLATTGGGNFTLYDAADMSTPITFDVTADAQYLTSAGVIVSGTVLGLFHAKFTTAEQIGAGTTKTYVLKADTTGASSANDDSLRVDVSDQTTLSAAAMTTTRNAISWNDDTETLPSLSAFVMSASIDTGSALSDQNGSITNGTYVKTLPVIGGTLVY